ncbi:MAG: glycosyltransferase, partial [Acidobacteria bacterium]|nr:glycosyltransferase [Acidobacteriota bacterium]
MRPRRPTRSWLRIGASLQAAGDTATAARPGTQGQPDTPARQSSSVPTVTHLRHPSISVVICAYTEDRWDDILAAVGSVLSQDVGPHEIIVVVDHNPSLYARLESDLPDVIVIKNGQARGLSGARNTGVAVAGGDVVAFLDDDAMAAPGWLRFLGAAYD